MNITYRTATHALLALTATMALGGAAQAAPFSIGNLAPTTAFFVQGQSFTPSVQGNGGSGVAPVSGTVYLDTFTIGYENLSSAFVNLYIYSALPLTANAATGVGSLATGTHQGGGVYDFANVALDAATTYFAVLPGSVQIYDGLGNPYSGGVDLFDRDPVDGQLDIGFGDYDIAFSASFTSAVPTPGTAPLVLLALAGLAYSRRQRTGA